MADGLAQTLFNDSECNPYSVVQDTKETLKIQGRKWTWKDGRGGFDDVFDSQGSDRHHMKVRQILAEPQTSLEEHLDEDWSQSYVSSIWLGPIYEFLRKFDRSAMLAYVLEQSNLLDYSWGGSRLWKRDEKNGLDFVCVPKDRVKETLQAAYEDGGHWGIKSTQMKVHRNFFRPNQGDSISEYIRGCPQCAKHTPWTKKPPIIPLPPLHPLQIPGMDFICPLPKTPRKHRYNLHLIDYFSSFSITFPTERPAGSDVIPHLQSTFSILPFPNLIYIHNGPHFINSHVWGFFIRNHTEIEERSTHASKSTGKIESSNRFLQDALRKSTLSLKTDNNHNQQEMTGDVKEDWDLALVETTRRLNARIIPDLRYSPMEILFGMSNEVKNALVLNSDTLDERPPLDTAKKTVQEWTSPEQMTVVQSRMISVCNIREESRSIGNFLKTYQANRINRGRKLANFNPGDLVMVKQHTQPKLTPKYPGPFAIVKPSSQRHISYCIRPIQARASFPFKVNSDDLKTFKSKPDNLANWTDDPIHWADLTVRTSHHN